MLMAMTLAYVALQAPPKKVELQDVKSIRALSSLKLDLAKIEVQGARMYELVRLGIKGEPDERQGTLECSTRADGDRLVLLDTWTIESRGKTRMLELTQTCAKDNSLTPQRLAVKGDGDEGPFSIDAKVHAVDAAGVRTGIMRFESKDVLGLPSETLTSAALLRLVPLLPREKGSVVSFGFWLEAEEFNLKREHFLECLGPDALRIGERSVACTKFEHRGGGIQAVEIWVDGAGALQRLLDGRKQWTLRSPPVKQDESAPNKEKSPSGK